MLTTKGFRDVVHIGRHQRPQHYSIMQDIPWQARPFVKRRHRHVVSERIAPPTGDVLEALNEDEVRAAARALKEAGVESVAICFLFSYLNPDHERRAAEIVAEEMPGAFVTSSADIFPQFREFERFTTACMNAFVGPSTGRYLERLAGALADEGVPREAARDDVERRRRLRRDGRAEARDAAPLRDRRRACSAGSGRARRRDASG